MDGWQVLDADAAVLWREYAFTPGAFATCLVYRGPEGLVVISPACGLEEADYAELARWGEVRALVANNDQHHLGLIPWRARFPGARVLASRTALATLQRHIPDIECLDGEAIGARVHELAGFTTGDVLVSIPTATGSVWYTGDLLTNIERLPGPPVRWLFTLTGSAPGLRLFRLAIWGFVRDRPALASQMDTLLAADPPAWLVPGHGPAIAGEDLVPRIRRELAKLGRFGLWG